MDTKTFVLTGHVDMGKSSLAGHLFAKCGGLSDHDLEKLEKDTENVKYQKWSRVLDICEEEMEKGKTHEFNIVNMDYRGKRYDLIDTPGHKTFIRSLIEGLNYCNPETIVSCLLVSAAKGEFEAGWINGQTKEDIILSRSVGIRNMIVIVNKMDTVDWNEEIYNNIVKKVAPFVNSCRFSYVTFIPLSGYHGINLVDKIGVPQWYTGKCFIDTLDSIEITVDPNTAPVEWTEKSWKSMMCEIQVLWVPNLIAPGFMCILHFDGNEYEVTIEKILKNKFLKERDVDTVVISSKVPMVRKEGSKDLGSGKNYFNRKIVLRYENNTVGFGKILKVKN